MVRGGLRARRRIAVHLLDYAPIHVVRLPLPALPDWIWIPVLIFILLAFMEFGWILAELSFDFRARGRVGSQKTRWDWLWFVAVCVLVVGIAVHFMDYAPIRVVRVPLPALPDWNWIPVLVLFLVSGAFGGIWRPSR